LPSALASGSAEAPGARGVSPYDFFAEVVDIPHSADARAFDAVSFFLSTPSLTGQLRDFLWASNDFFGPPSGAIASRRAIPVSADADALYGVMTMGSRVMPTPSPSPLSEPSWDAAGPPSSGAAEPFGEVWDKAVRSAGFSSDGADSNK
jgi:hypothetical protein